MTLQQIFYAIKVAETGSMNKAAERLFISQPTLTSAIKELENEIGIKIFSRNSKGVYVTNEGADFLDKSRHLYQQYELLMDDYSDISKLKQKFSVSTQHYSFAVKAFVDTINQFDTLNYEFAIRETKTYEVITDVATGRSNIGIIFQSSFNKNLINKLLYENGLEFHSVGKCKAYVYVHNTHPLADKETISFEELAPYPCLSFEQGEHGSTYLAEEILSDRDYSRVIKANDRATMLNLMIGVKGYTLCSGIVCEELNGDDYKVIPFLEDNNNHNVVMNIGYIIKKGEVFNNIEKIYINEVKRILDNNVVGIHNEERKQGA